MTCTALLRTFSLRRPMYATIAFALLAGGLVFLVMTQASAAQEAASTTLPCAEEPILGVADADEDGIVTTSELRDIDEDNAELETYAAQLDEMGVEGIRYANCENGTPTTDPAPIREQGDESPTEDSAASAADDNSGWLTMQTIALLALGAVMILAGVLLWKRSGA